MNIMLNGINYSYLEAGKGQTILLLHGFTGSKETWANLINRLKQNFHVIAIDLLGHGETESPNHEGRYMMEPAAKDLYDFLTKKQIETVHLLGYSMGGRLALYFALAYQNKIRSLILESCTAGLISDEDRIMRIKQDHDLSSLILNKGIESFVDYWENIPLFSSQKSLPRNIQENIKIGRLNQSPIGLSNSLKGMGTGVQPSLWNRLISLESKTLLVCGEFDEKFCLIMGKMNDKIVNSEIIKIPSAGHAIHVEQSEIFATIVSEFLLKREMEGIS
ncbi:2-succinyl-6-hydroxy-2,4-cyclohexadiene-1-carboxylate synthase [Bacillus sp. EAC]|uniref:2-succinyl-6-hydroxy-2, 4-cyclohexadiene-1-carboxylate synthase n=1 Tax=Bacillus sp. EAC TaxID=1978338 RepID=UPI0015C50583|nr:2-succinyl-6-hydroxy-2,4-cyclohexadiene-1-carboxylate synthase [Bacillus sp. EAC]